MKPDLRMDAASFLPPALFFTVITAFLYPYVKFPLGWPILIPLLILNGLEVLFTGYLRKKRGTDPAQGILREFAVFHILFGLLWLSLAGYLFTNITKEAPRPEYLVYYLLLFPTQWVLTLKMRQNLPDQETARIDLAEAIRQCKKSRSLTLLLQIFLGIVFLMGFRQARELPITVQIVYWINLSVSFLVILFINRQLEDLEWQGHNIPDRRVPGWYRFPGFLFLITAGLALFLSLKLPIISPGPFLQFLLLLFRKIMQFLIKPDKSPTQPETPPDDPILRETFDDSFRLARDGGTSEVAVVGDYILRLSIILFIALLLLLPVFRFLATAKQTRKRLLQKFFSDLKETLFLFFTPRKRSTPLYQEIFNRREENKPADRQLTVKHRIRRNSPYAWYREICDWGERKGYPFDPAIPPARYLEELSKLLPEKKDILVDAGLCFNRFFFGEIPFTPDEKKTLKKLTRLIIR